MLYTSFRRCYIRLWSEEFEAEKFALLIRYNTAIYLHVTAGADGNAKRRILGGHRTDARLLLNQILKSVKKRTAAGQDDAAVGNVCCQLRRR